MKSISEILKENQTFLSSFGLSVTEIDIKEKYYNIGRVWPKNSFVFCRDGFQEERIYVIYHPRKSCGWYFSKIFEGLIQDLILGKVVEKTNGIFGFGIDFLVKNED